MDAFPPVQFSINPLIFAHILGQLFVNLNKYIASTWNLILLFHISCLD